MNIILIDASSCYHFDGLVQERRNSSANALELRLFCTKPSIQSYPESIIDTIVATQFRPPHNELVTDRGVRRGCPSGSHCGWNQKTGKSEHYGIILQNHTFLGLLTKID